MTRPFARPTYDDHQDAAGRISTAAVPRERQAEIVRMAIVPMTQTAQAPVMDWRGIWIGFAIVIVPVLFVVGGALWVTP